MLDGSIALLGGQLDVLDRHVIGKVEPGAAFAGHRPEGGEVVGCVVGMWQRRRFGLDAKGLQSGEGRALPFREGCVGRECAVGGSGGGQAGDHAGFGDEGGDILSPNRAAVLVAGEVDEGVPTAGHQQRVDFKLELAASMGAGDGFEAAATLSVGDLGIGPDRDVLDMRGDLAAVQNGGNGDACLGQLVDDFARAVVVGVEGDTGTGGDTKAVQVGLRGGGEQNAGAVVVRKGDRTLDGTGGEDGLFGGDAPEAFSRQVRGGGKVQADPLQRAIGALIISADHRGAGHQADVGQGVQFGQRGGDPSRGGLVADPFGRHQQTPAHQAVLFGKDHVGPGAASGQGGDQAGGAGADHQHIAKGVGFFVNRGLVLALQGAKPGGAADQRFVQTLPKRAGPHEGLVVEARAEEGGGEVVHRQQVIGEGRPAVLAFRGQAVVDFLHSGAGVGGLAAAVEDFDKGVGFLGPGGQNAARAVVFEAAAHQADVIGQKRRGDCVALEALEGPAVEFEADGLAAVDQAFASDPHAAPPLRSATRSVDRISWVTVLRVTRSHEAQPVS